MTIDTSHNAFRGPVTRFFSLKRMICRVCGGSYPPHYPDDALLWGWGKIEPDPDIYYVGNTYSRDKQTGLFIFLDFNIDAQTIPPESCALIARDLAPFVPRLEELDGGFDEICQRFIDGCQQAADAGESLEFD